MTTTIELIKYIEMTVRYFGDAKLKKAAQRLRELDAKVTDLELKLLTERGAKAWKDVPDATAFVEELRGNKESA